MFEHVDELHGVVPSNLGECIASLDDDDASALVTDECVRPECSGSVYRAYLLFFVLHRLVLCSLTIHVDGLLPDGGVGTWV